MKPNSRGLNASLQDQIIRFPGGYRWSGTWIRISLSSMIPTRKEFLMAIFVLGFLLPALSSSESFLVEDGLPEA